MLSVPSVSKSIYPHFTWQSYVDPDASEATQSLYSPGGKTSYRMILWSL